MSGKILCVDFDGVIHSYTSGWQGATTINDRPVEGAIEWIMTVIGAGYRVAVYSSRSKEPGGPEAMRNWLTRWDEEDETGMGRLGILEAIQDGLITFPVYKPPAFLTIDDRAICFRGTFPHLREIGAFQSWVARAN